MFDLWLSNSKINRGLNKEGTVKYEVHHVNAALVRAMSDLMGGDAKFSAKSLEGTIAIFFFDAADWHAKQEAGEPLPDDFVNPWRADLESLVRMCEAIMRDCGRTGGRWQLIRKMRELSEQYMAEFRTARDEGMYNRNSGYIRDLDADSDWGRWMLALKEASASPEERRATKTA